MRLRKESDPRFIERRAWLSRGYRVCVGRDNQEHCFHFTRAEFEGLHHQIRARGVALVGQRGRQNLWWAGREDLFWADDELDAADVELLVWDRRRRLDARLHRLRKIRAREIRVLDARRERIPEDVRSFVWQRDAGRCVRCAAEDDLQFDHIIPWSRGGGNSVENIQILCGVCNRQKTDSV